MKLCKTCGCTMIWDNPHLPGQVTESPCNIEDWLICGECMTEHCGFANCHGCGYGKYPDCRFLEIKKQTLHG